MAGQEGEDVELLGGEVDRGSVEAGLVVDQIEVERPGGDRLAADLGGLGAAVTDGCTDAGFELGHAEGLGHVVVGPLVESGNLAVLGAAGRQDDDGDLTPLTDATAHGLTVDVGEAEIEDDHVGQSHCGLGDALFPVDRGDHLVPSGLQSEPQGTEQRRIVVDHQDLGHRYPRPFPLLDARASEKTKRAPPSGTSSTQIRPPWASTNVLAMASPSPARPPVSKRT